MIKLKNFDQDKTQNSNCDKTHEFKLWQNSKTEISTKLKNSKCDKTQKLKLWQNSKTQMVTKLKNSNCNETKKNELWKNLKTQIGTKIKNSCCNKNLKIKLWQNSKNQIETVLIVTYLSKNNLTPWQPIRCSWRSFLWFSGCFRRYGQSQGLLYKHRCRVFGNPVTLFFPLLYGAAMPKRLAMFHRLRAF